MKSVFRASKNKMSVSHVVSDVRLIETTFKLFGKEKLHFMVLMKNYHESGFHRCPKICPLTLQILEMLPMFPRKSEFSVHQRAKAVIMSFTYRTACKP